MAAFAVFLVSSAALAFEVLLARVLAITQWNPLAFMVIGVALFGGAASGSFLSLRDLENGRASRPRLQAAAGILFSAAVMAALLFFNRLPIDYFRLWHAPGQWGYLAAAFFVSALPFFCAGAVVGLAFVAFPQLTGRIYFAAMSGSALGALAPIPMTALWGEAVSMVLTALTPLPLAAAALFFRPSPGAGGRPARRWARALPAAAVLAAGAGAWLLSPAAASFRELPFSEYKSLAQVRQFPEVRTLETSFGIRGRLDRVQSPHLRFAPGLSLRYTGAMPPADAVFTDGDRPFFLYAPGPAAEAPVARATLSFAGYALFGRPQKVLVLAAGGGLSIACATASGAEAIRIVQPDARMAAIIGRHYGLPVTVDAARAFLVRSKETFDIIHIESWGPSVPGAGALDQEHAFTVESLSACFERLAPEGLLIASRNLLLPPSDALRLWGSAREALARVGAPEPGRCLAILRNWNTYTLIAGRRPFPDRGRILDLCRRGNFDVVYLDGADASDANRFNVFDRPFHFEEIRRLAAAVAAGRGPEFHAGYLLDVAPQTDLRPFPGRFLKWARAGDLRDALGGRLHAFFLSGEVVVAAVFAVALLLSALLLVLPAAVVARRQGLPSLRKPVYFFGIGAGFMLVELFFIHAGTFLLGDPVTSLALVLTAVLLSSGLGGLLSQSLGPRHLPIAALLAALLPLAAAAALAVFSEHCLRLAPMGRTAALFLAAAAAGFPLGLPFPLGMRFLMQRPVDKALAWAVNGCASVLASVAGAELAVSRGLEWLPAAAAAAYAAALLCSMRRPA
jgi:hypothetical protein